MTVYKIFRYEGMFDQIITFPSIQQTLLKCRREYFPRFPQTVEEFFAVFEEETVFQRYGHCFGELFFHGLIGNEVDGRCGIFFTNRDLEFFHSVKHEIKAFADATFKYQPLYFHQLFIVHFQIGNYVSYQVSFSNKSVYLLDIVYCYTYRHFQHFMFSWTGKPLPPISACSKL